MSAPGKTALSRNYEEILERRAELLSDVRSRHQQNHQREEPVETQTAMERNRRLLEDVRKTEKLLSQSQMTDPHLLSLETQYWVSVEAQIPTWQGSLLGTSLAPSPGPSLGPDPARPPRKAQQRSAAAKDPSRPPLPRPRGPL